MKILTLIVSFLLASSVYVSAAEKSFSGRVIFLDQNSLEIKYGKTERKFPLNESVKVFVKGTETTASSLMICQRIKLYYDVKGAPVRIDILKESDCVR